MGSAIINIERLSIIKFTAIIYIHKLRGQVSH